MHTSISKKLLAGLLSVVMVLSLFAAVPANNAQAASVSLSGNSVVSSGVTNTYKIKNLAKTQYAKVSVSGTATTGTATTSSAKSSVSVKKGSKTVKSTTKIAGTGSTISLKVKSTNGWGKSYKLTVKVYNKSTDKLVKTVSKSVKVYKKTSAIALDQTAVSLKAGETATLAATTTPASYVRPVAWSTSNASVATVADGVVTAVADGTATITVKSGTASATATITVASEEDPKDPEVKEVLPEIASVKAAQVDTLEVTFASAVTASDVTFSVARGSNNVTLDSTTWNADKTVATLKTDAKMAVGTYTVTAASASLSKEVKGEAVVENQRVDQIVILNDKALTIKTTPAGGGAEADAMGVVVYYDVLDQYGESIRTTTSIKWTTSCGDPADKDTSAGKLVLKRSDGKAFTYGEQIYVTGIYEKTGKSVNATLTVGMAQALDTIEIAGFVKANTSTIVDTLPADFKAGEYVMVYKALDQNKNSLGSSEDPTGYINAGDITFLSDNPMLIDSSIVDADNVVINGEIYCAAKINPGLKVSDGGEVNITAISGKTGNKTTKNIVIGSDVQLVSFTMSEPTELIADGEEVEIPFVALDQNGNEIKNFKTLAKNKDFNKLTFSVGVQGAYVQLNEENDGTASLTFVDRYVDWSETVTTDGQDRPAIVTAIVVNGTGSNVQFGIQDKARPDAVTGIDEWYDPYKYEYNKHWNDTMLEGVDGKITIDGLAYVDQYGRYMDGKHGTDNAIDFFNASERGLLKGQEYAGYKFRVKAEYKGDGFTDVSVDSKGVTYLNASLAGATYQGADPDGYPGYNELYLDKYAKVTYRTASGPWNDGYKAYNAYYEIADADSLTFTASTKVVNTAKTNDIVKFSIVKTKNGTDYEGVSSTKTVTFTTVDISQLSNWSVKDFKTLHVTTAASEFSSYASAGLGTLVEGASGAAIATLTNENAVPVSISAKYGNTTVKVPSEYYVIDSDKFEIDTIYRYYPISGANVPTTGLVAKDGALKWTDLYDAGTVNGLRKVANERIAIVAKQLYRNTDAGSGAAIGAAYAVAERPTVSSMNKTLKISDEPSKAVSIGTYGEVTLNPVATEFSTAMGNALCYNVWNQENNGYGVWTWLGCGYDQYGEPMMYGDDPDKYTYEVRNYVENPDGEVDGNHSVTGNGSNSVEIKGAERGDTFDFEVSIVNKDGSVASTTVAVTVGADCYSCVDSTANYYLTYVKPVLDSQRITN